jgi:tetratricopeptide (TPR) repeat protein
LAYAYGDADNFREAYKTATEFQRRAPSDSISARRLIIDIEKKNAQFQFKKWNIGGTYNRWSKPTPEQALANVQQQLRERQPTADLLTRCGVEYYRLGQFEEAITLFDRATELNPQNAEAYGRRGVTFSRLQQREQANADFLKACQLDVDTNLRR